ncbi:hypothetical protein [Escherichia coli]|uniref:F4 family fimbrial subunit n=1 Tax=Escherichia coli TaxID=562 RepID=UPI000DE9B674|nr:hypothetical protein [Escherichia coli]RBQ41299.1 hypothetical protein C2129_23645 [Escherichia coli]
MKKTLISLAMATSAVVSCSAMAWTTNGTGGTVDFGGTLSPTDKNTPWEVKTGTAVTGLDSVVKKGQSAVDITVNKAIPILGIRVADAQTKVFKGYSQISPQIDYHGAIDPSKFNLSSVVMTLDISDEKGNKMGKMAVDMLAVAESSWLAKDGYSGKKSLFAAKAGDGFFGGLPTNSSNVDLSVDNPSSDIINAIDPEFTANYDEQNGADHAPYPEPFTDLDASFSAFYGSGIVAGKNIHITLDSPVQGDAPVTWKASLPITVSYQ